MALSPLDPVATCECPRSYRRGHSSFGHPCGVRGCALFFGAPTAL